MKTFHPAHVSLPLGPRGIADARADGDGPNRAVLLWRLGRLRYDTSGTYNTTLDMPLSRKCPGNRRRPRSRRPCKAASAALCRTRPRLGTRPPTLDSRTTATGVSNAATTERPASGASKCTGRGPRWRRRPRPRSSPRPRRRGHGCQSRAGQRHHQVAADPLRSAIRRVAGGSGSPLSPQRRQAAQPADGGRLPQHDQGLRANEGRS